MNNVCIDGIGLVRTTSYLLHVIPHILHVVHFIQFYFNLQCNTSSSKPSSRLSSYHHHRHYYYWIHIKMNNAIGFVFVCVCARCTFIMFVMRVAKLERFRILNTLSGTQTHTSHTHSLQQTLLFMILLSNGFEEMWMGNFHHFIYLFFLLHSNNCHYLLLHTAYV